MKNDCAVKEVEKHLHESPTSMKYMAWLEEALTPTQAEEDRKLSGKGPLAATVTFFL